ncbi:OLC1v1018494C1 [Oldenlandia corymbosa var. corymbosa]|uniref:OLC1v1018494C1 n=1 Tax=Oldenlandia corymbosa var. corymbosa TaxID=529605 RepID=A0AAV1EBU0_OLDCO|nr:OLC1v1018494C1 [Oldenlandia corymbosa var. corymbosa]
MDMASAAANEISSSNSNTNNSKKRCQKRLFRDPRYGLVYDAWKDPSEEALSGGRGMFCIVPLADTLIKSASHTINHLACSTVEALKKPDLLKPEALQANINSQLQRVASSVKKPQFDFAMLMRASQR